MTCEGADGRTVFSDKRLDEHLVSVPFRGLTNSRKAYRSGCSFSRLPAYLQRRFSPITLLGQEPVFVDVEISAVVYRIEGMLDPTDERRVPVPKGLAWRGAVEFVRYRVDRRSSRAPTRAAQGDLSSSRVKAPAVRIVDR